MDFEWDSEKSDRNLRERGFDFAFASRIFEGLTVETEDIRRRYGEKRVIAVGRIGRRLYRVVYTDRPNARRIISSHLASLEDRKRWHSSK